MMMTTVVLAATLCWAPATHLDGLARTLAAALSFRVALLMRALVAVFASRLVQAAGAPAAMWRSGLLPLVIQAAAAACASPLGVQRTAPPAPFHS